MRTRLVALSGAAIVLAGIGAASLVATEHASSSARSEPRLAGPPRVLVQYGHVRSLVRKGGRFELRFDPAFWLGGVTANRAAVEDKVIPAGDTVPNDYYIRDETRRALTYVVPADARVTIVTNPTTGPRSTAITVSELAQIAKGRNPRHRPLFGPTLGFWIRTTTDTVRSLDQQYQP
jgi:hypothetical protein